MKRSTLFGLIGAGVAVLLLINFVIYTKVIKPAVDLRGSVVLEGPSMEPTYKEGALLRTKHADLSALRRGDVVLFADPTKLERRLVKRIVARAGDRIELRGDILFVNGDQVNEPYAKQPSGADIAPLVVPPGRVYVLGDNRGASLDSRHFGPVPIDHVIAVIVDKN